MLIEGKVQLKVALKVMAAFGAQFIGTRHSMVEFIKFVFLIGQLLVKKKIICKIHFEVGVKISPKSGSEGDGPFGASNRINYTCQGTPNAKQF